MGATQRENEMITLRKLESLGGGAVGFSNSKTITAAVIKGRTTDSRVSNTNMANKIIVLLLARAARIKTRAYYPIFSNPLYCHICCLPSRYP